MRTQLGKKSYIYQKIVIVVVSEDTEKKKEKNKKFPGTKWIFAMLQSTKINDVVMVSEDTK